jgi:hypothetical protein
MERADAIWQNNEVATFCATYNHPLMRFVVWLYWLCYRYLRWRGAIPDAMIDPGDPDADPQSTWEAMAGKAVGT